LTKENNLKVKKRYIISKTRTTFPPTQKKTLGYAQRQTCQKIWKQ